MPSNPVRVNPEHDRADPAILNEPVLVRAYEDRDRSALIRRLRLLVDQRGLLLRIAFCGLVLTTVIAFLIPPRFDAHAELMPPDSGPGSGLASMLAMSSQAGAGTLGMLVGDVLGLKTSGSLFIGVMHSRTVEDRIIEKFNLTSVYGVKRMQDARRILEENTQMSEDRKSGIIYLTVSDTNPQRAAAITQAYIAELDRMVAEVNTSSAHRERVFLEDRLKAVKQDLDSSAKEFSEFASKNAAIDIKEQGRAMVEAAATLQGRLIAAQSELEGLRQIYTDANVRVRAVRARIDELQKKLDQMGGGDVSSSAASSGSDATYPSIRKLPILGVTYAELYRRNKVQETLFDLLTQQCELAKVQEAKETPSVKVLDAPVVPEKKSFPSRSLIMFLGLLLSLMFGSLWILGKASWQQIDPQHPGKMLAQETYLKVRADLGLTSGNGTRFRHMREKILWFRRHPEDR